jgi:hypothetical protein
MWRTLVVMVVVLISTTASDKMPASTKKRVALFAFPSKIARNDYGIVAVKRARIVIQLDDKLDADATPGLSGYEMTAVVERYTVLFGGKIRVQQFEKTECDEPSSTTTCYSGFAFYIGFAKGTSSYIESAGVSYAKLFARGTRRYLVLGYAATARGTTPENAEAIVTEDAARGLAKRYVETVR